MKTNGQSYGLTPLTPLMMSSSPEKMAKAREIYGRYPVTCSYEAATNSASRLVAAAYGTNYVVDREEKLGLLYGLPLKVFVFVPPGEKYHHNQPHALRIELRTGGADLQTNQPELMGLMKLAGMSIPGRDFSAQQGPYPAYKPCAEVMRSWQQAHGSNYDWHSVRSAGHSNLPAAP
jgi:hypothetical protein